MMFRLRLRHLEERVKEARTEAARSRRALEATREHVVTRNAQFRERNHFADLIRASLLEGREQR